MENGIRENTTLDYKQAFNDSVGKTICSFINTEGGYIIFGVFEEDEQIKGIVGIEESFIEDFRKIFSNLDPYVEWDVVENLKITLNPEDQKVIIAKIPRGEHSVKLNGIYYVRIGAVSQKLTKDSEIIEIKKRKGEVDSLGREMARYKKIPKKDYSHFIGRREAFKKVIDELRGHHSIISIDGIGGVGKSTLALEIAHDIFDKRVFDSVLWFSAKKEKFFFTEITKMDPEFDNLDSLMECIANELEIENFDKFTKENKEKTILSLFKDQSIFLVIDNLETLEMTNAFIEFFAKIEGKSKILITSRKRIGQVERIIHLNSFNLEDTEEFIKREAENRSFELPEPKSEVFRTIFGITEGIPLAIKVMMQSAPRSALVESPYPYRVLLTSAALNAASQIGANTYLMHLIILNAISNDFRASRNTVVIGNVVDFYRSHSRSTIATDA